MHYRLFHRISITLILLLILTTSVLASPFDFTNPDSIKQKASEVLEALSPQKIVDAVTSGISSFIQQLAVCFGICIAVIIISSALSVITGRDGLPSNYELIGTCLMVLLLFSPLTKCFSMVQEQIEAISGFMISFVPTGVMLHTASGNTLSAALMSSTLPASITAIQLICVSLLLPITKASLSISAVNSFCSNSALDGLNSSLKGISLWICGFAFTVFTGILSLQTILQASADNIAMKGLKYGAAKLIPVAGGMISESMKTVIAGMKYIKSIVGISGILFIVYALIVPICYICAVKLSITVLVHTAKICDVGKIKTFLEGVQGIINILLALLLVSGVSFIIVLAMFTATNVSI